MQDGKLGTTERTCIHVRTVTNDPLSALLQNQIDLSLLVITKAIGQGSFGTVWKGIIAENIAVAVKQTRRTSKQAVAEFEKEIAIMQHLQSEYIVRVYGSVTLDSSLLIVMEYIGLGSLAELVDRNYLSPRMRMMYALHVCRGMKYLHAMKVIHRDLKPGNVLCVSNNIEDPVLCKITDFGASRVTDQDSTATFTMTKGIGSPFYMSPEMLRNDKQYTRAIDVYSFAIMCVELWNLQLPFSEHDFESAVGLFPCSCFLTFRVRISHIIVFNAFATTAFGMQVVAGLRPMLNSDCPDSLLAMLEVCWAEDPHERLCLLLFTITIFISAVCVTLKKQHLKRLRRNWTRFLLNSKDKKSLGLFTCDQRTLKTCTDTQITTTTARMTHKRTAE